MTKRNWSRFVFAALCFVAGWFAAQATPWQARAQEEEAGQGASSLYGLDIQVRKADEFEFTESTKQVGVEVLRDENNGNLIYITETGSICVLPPNRPDE